MLFSSPRLASPWLGDITPSLRISSRRRARRAGTTAGEAFSTRPVSCESGAASAVAANTQTGSEDVASSQGSGDAPDRPAQPVPPSKAPALKPSPGRSAGPLRPRPPRLIKPRGVGGEGSGPPDSPKTPRGPQGTAGVKDPASAFLRKERPLRPFGNPKSLILTVRTLCLLSHLSAI